MLVFYGYSQAYCTMYAIRYICIVIHEPLLTTVGAITTVPWVSCRKRLVLRGRISRNFSFYMHIIQASNIILFVNIYHTYILLVVVIHAYMIEMCRTCCAAASSSAFSSVRYRYRSPAPGALVAVSIAPPSPSLPDIIYSRVTVDCPRDGAATALEEGASGREEEALVDALCVIYTFKLTLFSTAIHSIDDCIFILPCG